MLIPEKLDFISAKYRLIRTFWNFGGNFRALPKIYLLSNYSGSPYSEPAIILRTEGANMIDKVPETLLQWQK